MKGRFVNKKKKKGLFITLEGPDGSGKSTQSLLLAKYLKRKGHKVVRTREPGGTSIAEALRRIILNPRNRISKVTEVFLYEAGRAQHTSELILPALREGKTVICERYADATLAYQGYGRKLDIQMVKELNRIGSFGLKPDLTILLDLDVREGLKRVRKTPGRRMDRMERESIRFHERVRKGYLEIASREPGRVKIIKVKKTPEKTHLEVVKVIEKLVK
ncbi:dTMP kinase [bacterium]|nr:dTMP kinase [bacterium]NIN93199.1 dTMP kinase [bacterium]NIO18996.1 dTMP kinase [bacterium]NIO74125.1 dTMP kinase [bacterium]